MLDREEIVVVVQQALGEAAGIDATEVDSEALLQEDLGLEPDDLEDVVAQLQEMLEIHISPDDLFSEETYEQQTVASIVESLEELTCSE